MPLPPYLQPQLPLQLPQPRAPHSRLVRRPLAVQLVDLPYLGSVRPAYGGEPLGLALAPYLRARVGERGGRDWLVDLPYLGSVRPAYGGEPLGLPLAPDLRVGT